MTRKDYVKRDITLIGRTKDSDDADACEVCTDADDFLSSVVKHDNRVTYKKIEVDTEEGEKIADEKKVSEIPYIEDCKTFKDGDKEKKRCRTISGFDESDWSDLSKLVPKEQKKEESESKSEPEKESKPESETKADEEETDMDIEEPEEPSEPL